MNLYAESSAILRWLFNEEGGDEILTLLRDAERVLCSRLSLVECRRVVRRASLERRISEAEQQEVLSVLAQAAARWAVLEISPRVAERAEAAFPVEPVRTLDAIHLSSALALREAVADLVVLSSDDRVRDNAGQLGFAVLPAIGEPPANSPTKN